MGFAFPKPRPRIQDRIAVKLEREAKDRAFRKAVWERDGGLCRHCGRPVKRSSDRLEARGEVHHRHGRRVRPGDRFNPDMAVLLCSLCHADPAVIARLRRTE